MDMGTHITRKRHKETKKKERKTGRCRSRPHARHLPFFQGFQQQMRKENSLATSEGRAVATTVRVCMCACGHVGMWCIRVCGHTGMWACGHVGIWACGHLGMWECGHVGIWPCGHVGAFILAFGHVCMWACGHDCSAHVFG